MKMKLTSRFILIRLPECSLTSAVVHWVTEKNLQGRIRIYLFYCCYIYDHDWKILVWWSIIHILYSEIHLLYVAILNRVRQPSSVGFVKFDRLKLKLLPIKDVIVPQKVKDELFAVPERERLDFLLACQKSYLTMADYLYINCVGTPGIAVLKFLRFLKPNTPNSFIWLGGHFRPI